MSDLPVIEVRSVKPNVSLIGGDYSIRRIYTAFKTCYAEEPPQDIVLDDVTRDEMSDYIRRRLATEHTSPLEHATFQFAVSGVSRVFTHQFVRHRVGVSVAQQSGRYTDPIETGEFLYVLPPSAEDRSDEWSVRMSVNVWAYQEAVAAGVPREDARMMLPGCQATNLTTTINFAALQHMCDVRMCLATQWEFREVVNLMRSEVVRSEPLLGKFLGPKCMEYRRGSCDEDLSTYHACKLSEVRPHRSERER